jgi:hypothetical protein
VYELRYCPRCDQETIWGSLGHDPVYVCAYLDDGNATPGCGLHPVTNNEPLTDEELERVREHADAPYERHDPRRLNVDRPVPRYHRV